MPKVCSQQSSLGDTQNTTFVEYRTRGSQLNEIYKQHYLQSVGKDKASINKKRKAALDYFDDWIQAQYSHRDYKRICGQAESAYQEIRQEENRKGNNDELPSKEDVSKAYAEEHFLPRIPFRVVLSLRDLLGNSTQ